MASSSWYSRDTSSGYLVPRACASARPDEVVRRDLRKERLRGRHADLGPGAGVEHRIALARDLAAIGVADRQHLGLLLLGVPDGLQRVGGLTGLRDGDDERVTIQNRVAVTEFAGQLDLDGQPGPVLDRVLGEQAGVIRGAAGHHEDLVDLAQLLIGEALLVEHDAPVDEVAEQGVGDRGGLLRDLLEHEVLVAALLGGRQIPVDVKLTEVDVGVAVEVGDSVAVGGDHHGLVLTEFDGVAGVLDERGDVRADEHLTVADADDQRCGPARGDDHAGLVGIGEHQGEVTLEAAQHGQHRGREVARGVAVVVGRGDQVDGHLGVGVAGELGACGLQLGAQRRKVLDDPVVDDGDLACGVAVRVGVAIRRAAVRGPAGVTHAGAALENTVVGLLERGLQVGQATRAAPDRQPARAVEQRNAR